jgi:hypothetical protein
MFGVHLGKIDRVISPALRVLNWQMMPTEANQFLKKAHDAVNSVNKRFLKFLFFVK